MKRIAVTIQKSETPFFLPLWKRYYGPFFDELIVIDGKIYLTDWWEQNNYWRDLANKRLGELYGKRQMVVFTDLDEYLVPDPEKYRDLGDYLNKVKHPVVKTTGYNIIEMPGDTSLDPSRKITDQRSMWQRDLMYDKPLISTVPIRYSRGFHACNKEAFVDAKLYLFHLRDAYVTGSTLYSRPVYTSEALEFRRSQAVPIPEKWRVL